MPFSVQKDYFRKTLQRNSLQGFLFRQRHFNGILLSYLHTAVIQFSEEIYDGVRGLKDYIHARVLQLADYIIENEATVRAAAAAFCVSKSTVHKDMRCRLKYVDPDKYDQVAQVLQYNLSERHIRGGIATKEKYRKMRIKKEIV